MIKLLEELNSNWIEFDGDGEEREGLVTQTERGNDRHF